MKLKLEKIRLTYDENRVHIRNKYSHLVIESKDLTEVIEFLKECKKVDKP